MIGQTISHYRVLSRLGAGGMGVVYEAEDLRLGRRVAVKVLPEGLEKRPEVLERFRREARSASSLNHPNICTIYEIEEHEGQQFIVMELLQGQTLAHKIGNRPLKTELVLEYGIQMADALDAAHKKGIVHRDIKSANLFLNDRGQVKVLDFGLAKLEEKAEPAAASAVTASAPAELTGRGTTMGTLLYMSPEQARGEELDARSDIFSMGTVLYEMSTGVLPFRGGATAVIFDEILNKTPASPSRLNPDLPQKLDEIVLRALEKDKDLRYQSSSDLRADLRRLKRDSESSQKSAAATIPAPPAKKRWWPYAAGAAVLAVLVAAFFGWHFWKSAPAPPASSQWEQITNFADSVSQPALSPDGHMVAFIRGPGTFISPGQICVKLLPSGEAKALTHDNIQKMSPAFTPDGSEIVYTGVGTDFSWNTYVVPVLGGEPQLLLPNASGLTWIDEHHLLFSEIKTGAHMAIVTSSEGRMQERDVFVPPTMRGMAHRSASSPDGRNVLVAEMDNNGWLPCRLLPISGGDTGRQVGPPNSHCTSAAWSPDGKWMFFSANVGGGFHLWRQSYPDGQPQQITFGPTEQEGIALDHDGTSLITAAGTEESTLWFHDQRGDRQISSEGYASQPKFSPDGKKLFFLTLGDRNPIQGWVSGELYAADLSSGQLTALAPGVLMSSYDISPDGKQIAFDAYDEQHRPHIWVSPVDRSAPPRQLFSEEGDQPMWAPGGVIYYRARQSNVNQIFRYRPTDAREKLGFPQINEMYSISPDGKWIVAWAPKPSDPKHTGDFAISTDDSQGVEICSDCLTSWSADGRHIAFISDVFSTGSEKTYLVPLKPGQDLPALPPGGWQTAAQIAALKPQIIDEVAFPAPGGQGYALERRTYHRNLYRIGLR